MFWVHLIPTLSQPWNQPPLHQVGVILVVHSIRDQDLGMRYDQLECLCFLVLWEDKAGKYMHVYRQTHIPICAHIYTQTYKCTCIHTYKYPNFRNCEFISVPPIPTRHHRVLYCLFPFHKFNVSSSSVRIWLLKAWTLLFICSSIHSLTHLKLF